MLFVDNVLHMFNSVTPPILAVTVTGVVCVATCLVPSQAELHEQRIVSGPPFAWLGAALGDVYLTPCVGPLARFVWTKNKPDHDRLETPRASALVTPRPDPALWACHYGHRYVGYAD